MMNNNIVEEFKNRASKYINTYIDEFIDAINELKLISIASNIDTNKNIIEFPTKDKNNIFEVINKVCNSVNEESSNSIPKYINKIIKKCKKYGDISTDDMMKRLIKNINKHKPFWDIGRDYRNNKIDIKYESLFFKYNNNIPVEENI